MRTVAIVVVLLIGCLVAPRPVAAARFPGPRVVVVVRDCTPSFGRYAPDAREAIARVTARLGPGDVFYMVDLGGAFDALTQVHPMILDPVPAFAHQAPRTILEFRKAQAALDESWDEAGRARARFLERLAQPCNRNGTPVRAVLEYVANLLERLVGVKLLIFLSDLETDSAGVRSSLPPAADFRFREVAVTALFVPWKGSAHNVRMANWGDWFKRAGAPSFTHYDEAQSRSVTPVGPSEVPRRAQSPFRVRTTGSSK